MSESGNGFQRWRAELFVGILAISACLVVAVDKYVVPKSSPSLAANLASVDIPYCCVSKTDPADYYPYDPTEGKCGPEYNKILGQCGGVTTTTTTPGSTTTSVPPTPTPTSTPTPNSFSTWRAVSIPYPKQATYLQGPEILAVEGGDILAYDWGDLASQPSEGLGECISIVWYPDVGKPRSRTLKCSMNTPDLWEIAFPVMQWRGADIIIVAARTRRSDGPGRLAQLSMFRLQGGFDGPLTLTEDWLVENGNRFFPLGFIGNDLYVLKNDLLTRYKTDSLYAPTPDPAYTMAVPQHFTDIGVGSDGALYALSSPFQTNEYITEWRYGNTSWEKTGRTLKYRDGFAFDGGFRKAPGGMIVDGAIVATVSHGNGPETGDWQLVLATTPGTTVPASWGHPDAMAGPPEREPCRTVQALTFVVEPKVFYSVYVRCGGERCYAYFPEQTKISIAAGGEFREMLSWPRGGYVRVDGSAYAQVSRESLYHNTTMGYFSVSPTITNQTVCD